MQNAHRNSIFGGPYENGEQFIDQQGNRTISETKKYVQRKMEYL